MLDTMNSKRKMTLEASVADDLERPQDPPHRPAPVAAARQRSRTHEHHGRRAGAARAPGAQPICDLTAPGDDDVRRRHRLERHQHRHRDACSGPAACRRFPGMGYPLVPGYESVGRVVAAGRAVGPRGRRHASSCPGANCFGDVRGLFGGAASRLVVPGARAMPVDEALGEQARAAGAGRHRLPRGVRRRPARPVVPPDLIVGHGVLGRLLARLTVAGRLRRTDGVGDQPARAQRRRGLHGASTRTTTRAATTARSTTSAATPPCSTR